MVARKRGFFYPARGAAVGHRRGQGKAASWARVYATLIRAGFGQSPADIGRLTARQIALFFREVQREERRRRSARIVDTNAAVNSKDGGKTLLSELKPED